MLKVSGNRGDTKLMTSIKIIENKLAELFKGVPDLPETSREALAKVWPALALVFGVLQLIAAWALWNVIRTADSVIQYSNFYVRNPDTLTGTDRLFIYTGVVVLLVDAVILLMAYPELKKRARRGWDLLFLGALINLGYSVLSIFIYNRGLGSFLFSLLGSAVAFYLLFQVRGKYGHVKAAKKQK